MPPLWFGYGWSTKRSWRALAGSGLRPVRSIPHHARIAVRVRVVDDELAARGVVRCEREAEQALLPAGDDLPADVEERLRLHLAALDDPDDPTLLDDVHRPRLAGSEDRLDRALEPRSDTDEAECARPLRGCGRARTGDQKQEHDDSESGGAAAHGDGI